ncbi:hypothetical protein C8J56DRAFT_1038831 [Mycena floridula]|nr:hypothetical protein C8J56DRAFT_1038831 [Mycena floridula]
MDRITITGLQLSPEKIFEPVAVTLGPETTWSVFCSRTAKEFKLGSESQSRMRLWKLNEPLAPDVSSIQNFFASEHNSSPATELISSTFDLTAFRKLLATSEFIQFFFYIDWGNNTARWDDSRHREMQFVSDTTTILRLHLPRLGTEEISFHPDGTVSMREETVKNLYDKLQKHQFVQMRGLPASGKTTLVRLLASYIRKQEPDVKIYEIFGKDDSYRYVAALEALPEDRSEKIYILWNKCHLTYDNTDIWTSFKPSQGKMNAIFIVSVCDYGSAGPYPNPDDPGTPRFMYQDARVNLLPMASWVSRLTWNDEFPVGLLLDDKELKDVVRRAKGVQKVDDNLIMMMSEWSGGYVGFVVFFLRFLADIHHDGRTVLTLEDFIRMNLVQRFYDYIKVEPTALCLPQAQDFDEINIIRIFRKILRDGFISQRDPHVDPRAFVECHRRGWIYEELDPLDDGPRRYDAVRYVFPYPFNHSWISYHLPQINDIFVDTTLYGFCLDTIKQFTSAQLWSPPNRASAAGKDRMAEAVYQDEFYRGMFDLVDVQVSPEFASATSRKGIEFYIPAKKWAIKVLREDDVLSGLDPMANYRRWIQAEITDFIILDFSVKEVDEPHPNIPELVHIQFDTDHSKFTILDHELAVKESHNLAEF